MDHPNQLGDRDSQFPAGGGEDMEKFFEGLDPLLLDFYPELAGTPQHGAPTGSLDESNSLNSHNPQAWNFVNQSVAGIEQSDQFGPLPPPGTQLLENQMRAEIQPLIQEQLDPAADKRNRKRATDRKYRNKRKDEEQKLKNKCQELENANQVMDQLLKEFRAQRKDQLQKEQQHLEKIAKVEAEKELAEKKCLLLTEKKSQLRQKAKVMKKKYKNLKKQFLMAETSEE